METYFSESIDLITILTVCVTNLAIVFVERVDLHIFIKFKKPISIIYKFNHFDIQLINIASSQSMHVNMNKSRYNK